MWALYIDQFSRYSYLGQNGQTLNSVQQTIWRHRAGRQLMFWHCSWHVPALQLTCSGTAADMFWRCSWHVVINSDVSRDTRDGIFEFDFQPPSQIRHQGQKYQQILSFVNPQYTVRVKSLQLTVNSLHQVRKLKKYAKYRWKFDESNLQLSCWVAQSCVTWWEILLSLSRHNFIS